MLFGAVGPRVFPQTDERLQAFEQLRMGRVKNRPANVQSLMETALPISAP